MFKQKQKHNKYYNGKLTQREKGKRFKLIFTFVLALSVVFTAFYQWAMWSPEYVHAEVSYTSVKESKVVAYEYYERVPVEVVRDEIRTQAGRYGASTECMDRIVYCESGYNNLAKNPKSTALGLSQYLIGTWQETKSFEERKARTDYIPSLKEMALDLANNEHNKWYASYNCWKSACK